ncbi:MAG: AAA family ATPase [Sedimentisphaerales bacterium]|nr:AAA family ATPase [Sedimentisphaerales bacterium]
MRTIAVLNQKGGVGKTTTVVNTAAALAAFGAKVLAIDFDPQAHLTIHLGVEPQSIDSGSYNVLTQSARLESEIMMVRDNLWLLPANIDLVGAESELVSVVGREIILREAIEQCQQDFDYCLIDCAPSLGLLTLNALAAAQEVLIPLQPHFLALQGFGKLLQTVEIVNRRINPSLRVNGILLCMFDSRASLPNEVKADIERFLNDARGTNSAWSEAHVLPVLVRRNIKLAEAPSYGKTIFEYENSCNGAQDYQKVAEFIHYRKLLSDESTEPVDVQQNAEQLASLQSEIQSENVEQTQEFETQSNDIQENIVETETEVSQNNNEEPEEYYTLSDESEISSDVQDQQQITEQNQPEQPEYSDQVHDVTSENNEIQENLNEIETEVSQDNNEEQPENNEQIQDVSPDTSDIQNNLNEAEQEVPQGDTNSGQVGYVIPKYEHLQKNGFQNHQQISEEEQQKQSESQPEYSEQIQDSSPEDSNIQENQDQPEQFENQPDYLNEVPKKPPFEIKEIQSHSSPEQEQYTQSPEESNQSEQNEDNPHSEHQGY